MDIAKRSSAQSGTSRSSSLVQVYPPPPASFLQGMIPVPHSFADPLPPPPPLSLLDAANSGGSSGGSGGSSGSPCHAYYQKPMSASSSVMSFATPTNGNGNFNNKHNNLSNQKLKPRPPPPPVAAPPSGKCLNNFLNDRFQLMDLNGTDSVSNMSSPGGPNSLAASTSISVFSVLTSATSSNNIAHNPLLCGGQFTGGHHPSHEELAAAAPDRAQWYHGRLDRKDAEVRLLAVSSMCNPYLIRKSDRKAGAYVLSFRGRSGINHFRITAVCGDYYCGGKQFMSLEELVGFYTTCSDLLKNERLVTPLPPPEPVAMRSKRVVAVLPYAKMPETDELNFRKGDIFEVHNEISEKWIWCTNLRNQEHGLVFADLVEPVAEDADPNEVYGWFHSRISKEEAFAKLSRAGQGSFLVRPSDNSPGDYSIFFHVDSSVQRFRVERHGDQYIMGGRVFESLDAVINRYKEEQIVEGHRLLKPVIKAPYETRWSASRAEELQAKSSDIYATIRECREAQLEQQNQEIKMKGYLWKKSTKTKKWKSLYCVLNSKEAMLYFYENPKRTKPKALIHLSYSALYMVHDSLFDRQFCFQLVERTLPCISTIYYLSANDADLQLEWMTAIRPLCSVNLSEVNSMIFRAVHEDPSFGTAAFIGTANDDNASGQTASVGAGSPSKRFQNGNTTTAAAANGNKGVSQLRSLYLTMTEARALPVKVAPHPYVVISLNTVKVARTSVKCPPDPIWEEDFVLEDIPADVTYFKLTLANKGKRSKDIELAEINFELSRFQAGEEFEEWLHFTGLSFSREDWGSVKVRVRFLNELIMPLKEYSPLKDLLLGDDLEVVAMVEDLCYHDRPQLANALLKISRYERLECKLLRGMVEREIQVENDMSTLFRSNSLTTTLVDQYTKATCQEFLIKSLTEPITKVIESKSCELNPSKLDSPTEACSNAEHLLVLLDEIVDIIFANACHCPSTVRFICGTIRAAVSQKWPNDTLVRTRSVSAFIFLRLICPAILNPRQFNLISDLPSESALRTFILVAKSLQNLANLVEFGTKEPWMEVVNPFILKNKSRMIKYIDEIASMPTAYLAGTITLEPDFVIKGQPDRELALVHSTCEQHLDKIHANAHNRPTIKKLATVIEVLSAHKNKYLDTM